MGNFDLSQILKDVSRTDTGREQIQYIQYSYLVPDQNNGYSMDGLEDLARSIEIVGLQQPLRVRLLSDDSYGIISGHRRHAAIGRLIAQGSALFDQGVPCIVDSGTVSAALRELQLLLGNADNRKLTSADEAQQAERISDCIRKLEDEGFVFPGRHRDWVAQLSGMSRTKLARLDAIRNNMTPSLYEAYKAYEINEASAYELQKLPATVQDAIAQSCKRSGSASFIRSFNASECVKRADSLLKNRNCKNGDVCDHKEARFIQVLRSQYSFQQCNGGCCLNCSDLNECKYPCDKGRDKQKTKKAADKEAREHEKEKREAEERKAQVRYRTSRQEQAKRVLSLIEELGLSDKDTLQGNYYYQKVSVAEIRKAASGDFGDAHFYDDRLMPSEVSALAKWADRLGCTLDYLVGRSKNPKAVAELDGAPEQELDILPSWQTGKPHEGRYLCLVEMGLSKLHEQRCEYRDGAWTAYGNPIDNVFTVKAWWPLPAEQSIVMDEKDDEMENQNADKN